MNREIKMNQLRRIQSTAAPLAVLSYVLCTLAAYSRLQGSFSPVQNWLSDLGDIQQNPRGALFYNLGIILTGLLILVFFVTFSQRKMENHKVQNRMVQLTRMFGILGSLAMVMSALYPIDHPQQHEYWSVSLYILLGTAFAFSVFALRYDPRVPRWVLVLGCITAFVDLLSGIFHEVTLLEWLTVMLFLAYLFTIGRNAADPIQTFFYSHKPIEQGKQ